MKERIDLVRYAAGRHIMLLGIKMMPTGPARKDLIELLEIWADNVLVDISIARLKERRERRAAILATEQELGDAENI